MIHQVWLSELEQMPQAWVESSKSWLEHNPDWEYRLWRASDIENLIDEHFPDMREFWSTLPYLVVKADVARYLILYTHGGLYADHDVVCNRAVPAELLQHQNILPTTKPFGVSNDFFMTTRRSDFMAQVVKGLVPSLKFWNRWYVPPYLRVIAGVGSLYLSFQCWRADGSSIYKLEPCLYSEGGELAVVRHIKGNSWGEWDSYFVRWAFRRKRWIALLVLLMILWTLRLKCFVRSLNSEPG